MDDVSICRASYSYYRGQPLICESIYRVFIVLAIA